MRLRPATFAFPALLVAGLVLAVAIGAPPTEIAVGTVLGAWLLVLGIVGVAGLALGAAGPLVLPVVGAGVVVAGATWWVRTGRRHAAVEAVRTV